jgi:hypothetical protein
MAYTATITGYMTHVSKLKGPPGLAIFTGTCNLSVYGTLAEITGITGKFKGTPAVICNSSGAYTTEWDATNKCFRAFVSSTGVECTTENVGTFQFIAIGVAP